MPKISKGNSKLGKDMPNISLPPIVSCKSGAPCAKHCYANKSYRLYPTVKNAWDHNWDLYNSDPDKYFSGIDSYLLNKQPMFFRWHVSGDIPNSYYLKMMVKLSKDYKGTRFLAFTKQYELFKGVKIPKNLSIVFSAWPGYDMPKQNRFPVAYMQDGTETRVHNTIECPGNCESCGMCWSLKDIGKNVVFNKH